MKMTTTKLIEINEGLRNKFNVEINLGDCAEQVLNDLKEASKDILCWGFVDELIKIIENGN